MKAWVVHPVFVAALVAGLNALKPAAVDDTAYLLLARQIAAHPLDPYGGELFWYAEPLPALHVLAPPVLPYWLALGIRLFGDQLPLLGPVLGGLGAALAGVEHLLSPSPAPAAHPATPSPSPSSPAAGHSSQGLLGGLLNLLGL